MNSIESPPLRCSLDEDNSSWRATSRHLHQFDALHVRPRDVRGPALPMLPFGEVARAAGVEAGGRNCRIVPPTRSVAAEYSPFCWTRPSLHSRCDRSEEHTSELQ